MAGQPGSLSLHPLTSPNFPVLSLSSFVVAEKKENYALGNKVAAILAQATQEFLARKVLPPLYPPTRLSFTLQSTHIGFSVKPHLSAGESQAHAACQRSSLHHRPGTLRGSLQTWK